MNNSFPCPYCKGQGSWIEVVIEETGEGPIYQCGICEGEAMVEIDGRIHDKIRSLSSKHSSRNGYLCIQS